MRRLAPVLAAVAGLALGAVAGAAQCTGTPYTISPASPGAIVLPPPTYIDFDNGYITYTGTVTVTVTPPNNGRYALCARAGTPDMGQARYVSYTKPITDIRVKATTAATYVSLLQTDLPLVTGLKRAQTVTLNLQLRLAWDPEGDYGSVIVLTAY